MRLAYDEIMTMSEGYSIDDPDITDEVIAHLAQIIVSMVGLSRLSGDEFIDLIEDDISEE